MQALKAQLSQARGRAFELHRAHVNPGFVDLLQLAGYGRSFVRASGAWLEDESGERYLDFCSGYGVLNLGHNHPRVKAALSEALEEGFAGFAQVDCPPLAGLAAQALASQMPEDLDKVFFCSSGTEAVEAALKLARAATRRHRLVSCELAYHGLTLGSLALNGNAKLRDPFLPLTPGAARIPYDDLDALASEFRRGDVAAFVVEPILGEGGAVSPRPGFLREAQAMCRKAGALLVVDEVQTGMGRTGAMFAFSKDGVVPDAVCLAKALGGGLMPVGAMVARGEVFARAFGTAATCRLHATTFGGGPLAMAAVLATLDTLREEKLVERAAVEGRYLEDRLRELARRHKTIREVRGRGLMLALKFQDASRGLLDRTPFAKLSEASASLLVQHVALQLMKEHKIVAQLAGNDGSVLKVMPPLVVAREESDRFVAALDQILEGAGHAKALASLAAEVVKARL